MGYYTEFKLAIENEDVESFFDVNSSLLHKVIIATDTPGFPNYYDFDYVRRACLGLQEMKWYHYQEHMIEISKAFPTKTFILQGVGCEDVDDDEWIAVFKNGNHAYENIHDSIDDESDFLSVSQISK